MYDSGLAVKAATHFRFDLNIAEHSGIIVTGFQNIWHPTPK